MPPPIAAAPEWFKRKTPATRRVVQARGATRERDRSRPGAEHAEKRERDREALMELS